MKFENEAVPEVLDRLRRIEGQVGGIIRMIERGRDCSEVIHQVAAVRSALDRAGVRLLSSQLGRCLADEAAARENGYDEEAFERLFLMLT